MIMSKLRERVLHCDACGEKTVHYLEDELQCWMCSYCEEIWEG